MFRLSHSPTIDLEYVDNMWIHFHGGLGLVSVYMNKESLVEFTDFLRGCRFQDESTSRRRTIGKLEITSEGPDEIQNEKLFNILIGGEGILIVFPITSEEIPKLIVELEESVDTEATPESQRTH